MGETRLVEGAVRITYGAVCLTVMACSAGGAASQEFNTRQGRIRVVEVARGLEHPWAVAFLPDGRMLVTERPGRLRIVTAEGTVSPPLTGVPAVYAEGQGGLLDVVLDPDFAGNRTIWLTYSEPGEGGSGTALARARLADGGLENVEVVFRQQPKITSSAHFGSRIVFTPDGYIFVTLGERRRQNMAQDLNIHMGKVVRLRRDGSVPPDNPFVGRSDARPEIWSYGNRNPQGAALHPETGVLWTVEHGAMGGDEINIPAAGRNYGWPVISYGRDYSGAPIGEGRAKEGMEQPVHYWDPSIAPSGMTFYTGDRFPEWKGDLFIGSLKFGYLARLELNGNQVASEERLLEDRNERIRDVRQGPDGLLYVLTEEDNGKLLRIEPVP
jgi:glucose/arabinose dehydrogenase